MMSGAEWLQNVGQFAIVGDIDLPVAIAGLRGRARKDQHPAGVFIDAEQLGAERLACLFDAAELFDPMVGQHCDPVAALDAALGPDRMIRRVVDFQSGEALSDAEDLLLMHLRTSIVVHGQNADPTVTMKRLQALRPAQNQLGKVGGALGQETQGQGDRQVGQIVRVHLAFHPG